jgi:hypothetical protein
MTSGGELHSQWAYHDDADSIDDRTTEKVPGENLAFIGNGTAFISSEEPVILHVLTDRNFAGDREEQVFARWWNGEEEHWVMGRWKKNILLGGLDTFHGKPLDGDVTLDLWEIRVEPDMTRPGENYYVIQLKGWAENAEADEIYLLHNPGSAGATANELNQAWTAGDYYGRDWSVTISD